MPGRRPGWARPAAWRLSFPLHPPGRPEKSRLDELRGSRRAHPGGPGEQDTIGRPEEFPDDLDHVDFAVVPGGDHGCGCRSPLRLSEAEAMEIVVESTLEWLVREVGGPDRGMTSARWLLNHT